MDRVERDRQHRAHFIAQRANLRHNTGSGNSDATLGQRQSIAIAEHTDCLAHMVKIIQRLAHAHEDDVGHDARTLARDQAIGWRCQAGIIPQHVARHDQLRDNFLRSQVAHEALSAGMAEGAGQRAANLRRNAQRAAIAFRDIDAFDLRALVFGVERCKADQPFARAIGGHLLGHHFRAGKRIGIA